MYRHSCKAIIHQQLVHLQRLLDILQRLVHGETFGDAVGWMKGSQDFEKSEKALKAYLGCIEYYHAKRVEG